MYQVVKLERESGGGGADHLRTEAQDAGGASWGGELEVHTVRPVDPWNSDASAWEHCLPGTGISDLTYLFISCIYVFSLLGRTQG